ncbi:MAG: hypothetical protein RLZZ393_1584 [Pseudomonadota bacterium]|jgi:translocation and assembly module TamB
MTRRRRIHFALLALLLLTPAALLLFVAGTERGLQMLAARLGRIGPVTLRLEGVSGTLARGAHIDVLDIRHRRVHLHFTGIDGRLRLAPLLWQTIRVTDLRIDTLLIEVPRVPDNKLPWKPHFLPPLMRIHADAVRVSRGTLVVPNGTRLEATQLDAAGSVYPSQVRIHRGAFDMPTLHVTTDGRLLAKDPLRYAGQAGAAWQLPGQPLWTATASFDGDTITLPFTAAITAPFHASVSARFADMNKAWRLDGKAKVKDFDIVPFGGGSLLGKMAGDLAIGWNGNGFSARGTAEAPAFAAGLFDVDFDGFVAQRRLTIRSAGATHRSSAARLTTRGTVDVLPGKRPLLALDGTWQEFRWPLRGADPVIRSKDGRYQLAGDRPWRLEASGDMDLGSFAPMQTDAEALLDGGGIKMTRGHVAAFGGHLDLHGSATWSPGRAWSIGGTARDIDLRHWRADLPGRIGLDFNAAGRRFDASGDFDITLDRLSGTVRGAAASGQGQINRRGEEWRIKGLDMRLGRTRLTADGRYGLQRDLRFGITADDLGLLSPEARGRLVARGSLSGTAKAPVLGLRAQGSGFALGRAALRSLDADVDIDLRPGGATMGRLRMRDLRFGARLVDTAEVELDGRAEDNSLLVIVNASGLQVSLGAHGGFREGQWHGSLRDFDANDGGALRLTLESQRPLEFGTGGLLAAPFCLKGKSERVCAAADSKAGIWNANLEAHQLPLRTLTAGLSQDIDYEGTIDARLTLHGAAGQAPTAQLQATLADALLRHHLTKDREERLAFGSGSVDALATAEDFTLRVGLDAGNAGNLHGQLAGRRTGGSWREHPVHGDFALETDGLNLLDAYVPGLDRSAGRLTATARVDGTLGAPELDGSLQLRKGEVDLYAVNLALRDISLDARLDGRGLEFSGSTRAGEGTGRASGKLEWRDRRPYGAMHLEGENLRVVDVPEARVVASPRLDFRIDGNRIDVAGEVRIPQASLEPVTITNAVLSSGDEVVAGLPATQRQRPWQVTSDVAVSLGDKVTLESHGLKGRITGSIRTHTDELQASHGTGELSVADGKYAAFGRMLDIARGRLIFSNGPLNDPAVDLRAQKVFPDVTAGVNVRGSLRAPRMTFFSEPAIPQSQIVSLILAGGSLDSVQNGARQGAARNEALAQGGAIIAQQIGSRVGIQDVGIESDTANETSLVLGKYLSPRLYVSYGISLAEAINTVKLRYTLGDHWTVKTESGKARSADLVYTIQK